MTEETLSSPARIPLVTPALRVAKRERLGAPVVGLALLLTSYFYTLPLGRFSFFGIESDWRIYDFAFVGVFFLFGLPHINKLIRFASKRGSLYRVALFLLFLVWASLFLTASTSGTKALFPALIRAFRFTAYFAAAAMITYHIDSPKKLRFMLGVFYVNIAVQALLATLQGIGVMPSLWPTYWLVNYGAQPVGTLSPHHKQIGVVMVLGIAITATYLRTMRGAIRRSFLIGGLALMLAVPIFAGTRTGWLGVLVFFAAYLYKNRVRGALTMVIVGIGAFAVYLLLQDWVSNPLTEGLDSRFFSIYEKEGAYGVYGSRAKIHLENIPRTIRRDPWILFVGTGFQNLSRYLGIAGAHNNFAQVWLELGLLGFVFFLTMLRRILRTLTEASKKARTILEKRLADDGWAAFFAVIATMLVGETLYAQYSMFTLTGQIMAFVAIGAASLNWSESEGA